MSDEWMILIEILTSWILMAFSAIAPIGTGARMGTGLNGGKGRAFPSDFFPNLRIFFFFFPRPTTCDLRPAALSHLLLNQAHSLSKQGHSLSNQGLPLSKQGQSLSKSGYPLSKQALFALYLEANCSFFAKAA